MIDRKFHLKKRTHLSLVRSGCNGDDNHGDDKVYDQINDNHVADQVDDNMAMTAIMMIKYIMTMIDLIIMNIEVLRPSGESQHVIESKGRIHSRQVKHF